MKNFIKIITLLNSILKIKPNSYPEVGSLTSEVAGSSTASWKSVDGDEVISRDIENLSTITNLLSPKSQIWPSLKSKICRKIKY